MNTDPVRIISATASDYSLLAGMGRQAFIESHGHSAPEKDILAYVNERYDEAFIRAELADERNLFHLLYYEGEPAGYSKIIPDTDHPNINRPGITKLERIYFLKPFYGKGLGRILLDFNIGLSKQSGQKGMWLFVWTENKRALQLYLRSGFRSVADYDFRISPTHTNPNYQMLLLY